MPPSTTSSQMDHPRRDRSRGRETWDRFPSERDGAPPPKRQRMIVLSNKRRPTDEFGIAARMITRVHKMNWEPFAVINAGVALLVAGTQDPNAVEVELASASEKWAARALIYPPTVANRDDKPDHQSNRKSKANVYGIEEVTPSFLAYVAVAVRFALSSEPVFRLSGGLFDYERFYNDIVTYLNDPIFRPDTDQLLEWWNTSSGLFTLKHADPEDEPESMLARLRRQAEARGQPLGGNDH